MTVSPRTAVLPVRTFHASLIAHKDGRKRGLLTLTVHGVHPETPPRSLLPGGSTVADMIVPFESRTLTPIGVKWIGNDLELSFYSALLATSGTFPANVCLVLDETVFGRAAASVPVLPATKATAHVSDSSKILAGSASAKTTARQRHAGWQDAEQRPEKDAVISWNVPEAAGSVFAAAASSALVGLLLRFLT